MKCCVAYGACLGMTLTMCGCTSSSTMRLRNSTSEMIIVGVAVPNGTFVGNPYPDSRYWTKLAPGEQWDSRDGHDLAAGKPRTQPHSYHRCAVIYVGVRDTWYTSSLCGRSVACTIHEGAHGELLIEQSGLDSMSMRPASVSDARQAILAR